jgi:hypothetical protein
MLRSGQRQGDQLREGNALLGQSQAGNQGKTAAKQLGVGQEVWFSSVGVDGLMKAIGLSGGAFYNHFSSKDELFRPLSSVSCVKAWNGWGLIRTGINSSDA